MQKIKIEKIVLKDNIRKDLGDITELTASIKENGVRHPLELDHKNELVDGYRRLEGAIAAGLDEVPFFENELGINRIEEQLISGVFQKNLNPMEEAQAFRKYLDEQKVQICTLAARIGKSESYIEKRLLLLNLPKQAQDAIISKKIQLGHALVLAKMPNKDAAKFLKEINREDYSVAATKSALEYHDQCKNLSKACFNTDDCKKCNHNGSVQTELFETGKTLNGACLNPGCFNKKTAMKVKQIKKEFKDVLFVKTEEEYAPKGYVHGEYHSDERLNSKFKRKCRKKRDRDNYLVEVSDTGDITEYFKLPDKKNSESNEKQATTSSDKLNEKVGEFKRKILLDKTAELLDSEHVCKALAVIHFAERDITGDGSDKDYKDYEDMIKNKHKTLDSDFKELTKQVIPELDNELLEVVAVEEGFRWKVDFMMSGEFLKLHTKAQMSKLAKELKIDVSDCEKNSEFRDKIIKDWKTGQVPKIIGGGSNVRNNK